MIALRDVSKSDECTYAVWQNDSKLKVYLSRLYPKNCSVGDYDVSRVCWFIIKEDTRDIGSI